MTFYVSGAGLLTGTARGTGRAAVVLAGQGAMTPALVGGVFFTCALDGQGSLAGSLLGRGRLALAAQGGSTITATIIGVSGGPTFGDMSVSIAGSGRLTWTNTAIHPSQMEFWFDDRPKAKPIRRRLRMRIAAHGSVAATVRADGLMTAQLTGGSSARATVIGRFELTPEQLAVAIFAAYRRAA
jgi:hypothetical protein